MAKIERLMGTEDSITIGILSEISVYTAGRAVQADAL